jgi:RNA polymerase sigma factor (TIGR02999 family)
MATLEGSGAGREKRGSVDELLGAWSTGDAEARDRLLPLVYEDLRRRAATLLRRERRTHTLEPGALVHDAYLRLVEQKRTVWRNKAQFLAVATELMWRVLVDHGRAHRAAKRSGRWSQVPLDPAQAQCGPARVEVLDLARGLARLAAFDPRKSRIAELRFLAGLSLAETGAVMGLSVATIEREWQAARAWLLAVLREPGRAETAKSLTP